MKKLALIGAGGHARSFINLLELNSFDIIGIYDDSYEQSKQEIIGGYPLTGKVDECPQNIKIALALGDNKKREMLFRRFLPYLIKENLFHPKSITEERVTWGASNQIFAHAYINAGAIIGDNNIINTGAIVEHEVRVGNHNHISVHSTICGRATIGNNCFIGAGAVVIDKITILDNVIIGANSVVTKNILDAGVYVGNPVRRMK